MTELCPIRSAAPVERETDEPDRPSDDLLQAADRAALVLIWNLLG